MDEINEVLLKIKNKPGLYIGKESLALLAAFIDGYIYANNLKEKTKLKFLPGFQEWIIEKYNANVSHRWVDIINFYELDDVKAFKKFFDLYDEYNLNKLEQ